MHILIFNPNNEACLPKLQLAQLNENGHTITVARDNKEGRKYFETHHKNLNMVVLTPVTKDNHADTTSLAVETYQEVKQYITVKRPIPVVVLHCRGEKNKTMTAFKDFWKDINNGKIMFLERPKRTREYQCLLNLGARLLKPKQD